MVLGHSNAQAEWSFVSNYKWAPVLYLEVERNWLNSYIAKIRIHHRKWIKSYRIHFSLKEDDIIFDGFTFGTNTHREVDTSLNYSLDDSSIIDILRDIKYIEDISYFKESQMSPVIWGTSDVALGILEQQWKRNICSNIYFLPAASIVDDEYIVFVVERPTRHIFKAWYSIERRSVKSKDRGDLFWYGLAQKILLDELTIQTERGSEFIDSESHFTEQERSTIISEMKIYIHTYLFWSRDKSAV